MTILDSKEKRCAVCGSRVTCTILCSTSTFGSPDLDLRPAEMQRSSMHVWLQECTECHYVAEDIEKSSTKAGDVINSTEYQEIRNNIKLPELVSRFLRFSLLHENDYESSGIAKLRAAWVCDDNGDDNLAKKCRNDAADCLNKLQPFDDSEEGIGLGCRLVDILRRSSRFEESNKLSSQLKISKTVASNEFTRSILNFQEELCRKKNIQCYNILDVVNGS